MLIHHYYYLATFHFIYVVFLLFVKNKTSFCCNICKVVSLLYVYSGYNYIGSKKQL